MILSHVTLFDLGGHLFERKVVYTVSVESLEVGQMSIANPIDEL